MLPLLSGAGGLDSRVPVLVVDVEPGWSESSAHELKGLFFMSAEAVRKSVDFELRVRAAAVPGRVSEGSEGSKALRRSGAEELKAFCPPKSLTAFLSFITCLVFSV